MIIGNVGRIFTFHDLDAVMFFKYSVDPHFWFSDEGIYY
jgi:hypothetical protein